jgi:hypothetical protein
MGVNIYIERNEEHTDREQESQYSKCLHPPYCVNQLPPLISTTDLRDLYLCWGPQGCSKSCHHPKMARPGGDRDVNFSALIVLREGRSERDRGRMREGKSKGENVKGE